MAIVARQIDQTAVTPIRVVSMCLTVRYTQPQLDRIARELNTRPPKTLGYRPPADILAETVASTG